MTATEINEKMANETNNVTVANGPVFSRDGVRAICWLTVCPMGRNPGDTITALKNGRRFSGTLVYVVECAYQGHEGSYIEYRCDTFSCHENEIVDTKRATP